MHVVRDWEMWELWNKVKKMIIGISFLDLEYINGLNGTSLILRWKYSLVMENFIWCGHHCLLGGGL